VLLFCPATPLHCGGSGMVTGTPVIGYDAGNCAGYKATTNHSGLNMCRPPTV